MDVTKCLSEELKDYGGQWKWFVKELEEKTCRKAFICIKDTAAFLYVYTVC